MNWLIAWNWMSHLVVLRRRFERPNGWAAANIMIRPRSRHANAEIASSLSANALAFDTRLELDKSCFAEPDFDLSASGAAFHFELPRECVELGELSNETISAPLEWRKIEVVGCVFERPAEVDVSQRPPRRSSHPTTDSKRQTRIRPPRDLVKLEDRLRVLLQPPLEALLAARLLMLSPLPHCAHALMD